PVFQVTEQPALHNQVPYEIVRLIYDQDHSATVLGLLHQQLVEREQDLDLRCPGAGQIQIVGDHHEDLVGVDARIEDEGELDVLGFQVIAQAFEHGRLAG